MPPKRASIWNDECSHKRNSFKTGESCYVPGGPGLVVEVREVEEGDELYRQGNKEYIFTHFNYLDPWDLAAFILSLLTVCPLYSTQHRHCA